MESRNPLYRFVLTSALGAALAACGGANTDPGASLAGRTVVAECSVAMPANSTALEVQRTIDAVQSGQLDPCDGAVDLKGTSAELLRIDGEEDLSIRIFFRIYRANEQLP